MKQAFATLLLTGMLAGCSTLGSWSESILGGEDNLEEPAPLVDIESPVPATVRLPFLIEKVEAGRHLFKVLPDDEETWILDSIDALPALA